jgi:hypothetical protein
MPTNRFPGPPDVCLGCRMEEHEKCAGIFCGCKDKDHPVQESARDRSDHTDRPDTEGVADHSPWSSGQSILRLSTEATI